MRNTDQDIWMGVVFCQLVYTPLCLCWIRIEAWLTRLARGYRVVWFCSRMLRVGMAGCEHGTRARETVGRVCQSPLWDFHGQGLIGRRTEDASKMANIAAHENKCIRGSACEGPNVAHGVLNEERQSMSIWTRQQDMHTPGTLSR